MCYYCNKNSREYLTFGYNDFKMILPTTLEPFKKIIDKEKENDFLWQDRGTFHATSSSLSALRNSSGKRTIVFPVTRSPCSTPCDCHLYGYFEDALYKNNPHTEGNHKEIITCALLKVSRKLRTVFSHLFTRYQERLRVIGHFPASVLTRRRLNNVKW